MKKRILIVVLLAFAFILTLYFMKKTDRKGGVRELKFGKTFTISILNHEVCDAQYLQDVLDGTNEDMLSSKWILLDNEALKTMIAYMEQNDYYIVPGEYRINQTWGFEDGLLVMNNGEQREIFVFRAKADTQNVLP